MHNTIAIKPFKLFFAVFSLLFFLTAAEAQNRINTPYSIYGVGDLRLNQNFSNLGMGGIGVAFGNNRSINEVNPASYTRLDTTSFVFEATLFSHFAEQETVDQSQQSNYSSLGSLAFGFPVTKWWAFGFGLKPFSSVGYKMSDESFDEQYGNIDYLYEGMGGINQVFLGTAIEPVRGLSIGVNASYLFGNLDRHTTVSSDSSGFFQTSLINNNQVNGWHMALGVQYEHRFAENRSLTFGAIYGNETDISASKNEIVRRQLPGVTRWDTIRKAEVASGNLTIPSYYGAGVFFKFNPQWQAGLDYTYQNWEDYQIYGTTEDLNNSYQVAFGLQHNPEVTTYTTFLSRMEYRAGFRFGQSYLKPNGNNIDEFGISFGVGLPIRRSLSGLNIGVEYSQRGTTDDNLIKENFFRITLGVNVYERWFIRPRFF